MSRRGGLVALLVVGAAAVVWWLWGLYWAPNRADLSGYWQLVVAIPSLAVAVVALVRDGRARGAPDASDRVDPDSAARLGWLSDRLADAVEQQWTQTAVARRLVEPEPIAVRWARPALPVAGPASAAAASTRFAPLPGLTAVRAEDLRGGGVRELHGVYGGVGSGRLVIVGAPGAGKSGAAVLLLLDALRHRRGVPDAERAGVPVPMLFTLHEWNPRTQPLRTWLLDQLQASYDALFGGGRGAHDAGRLIDQGKIAVIADGLDEITEEFRPLVLQALSEQATFRLVVLARGAEMVRVVERAVLEGAVAVELQDVDPAAAADYLSRVQRDPPPHRWRELIELLRSAPDGPLARALGTPLILTLVRDTFRAGDDVGELLGHCAGLGPDLTREAVEDHLLDRVLPQAYAPRPGQPEPSYAFPTARRALEVIAGRMNRDRTRDLAWWRIPGWVSTFPRLLTVGVAAGLPVWIGLHLLPEQEAPEGWLALAIAVASAAGGMVAGWLTGRRIARVSSTPRRSPLRHPAAIFILGLVVGTLFSRGNQPSPAAAWMGPFGELMMSLVYAGVFYLGLSLLVKLVLRRYRKRHRDTVVPPWHLIRRQPGFSLMPGLLGAMAVSWPVGMAIPMVLVLAVAIGLGLRLGLSRAARVSVTALTPLGLWRQTRVHSLVTVPLLGIFAGWLMLPRVEFGIWDVLDTDPSLVEVVLTSLGLALLVGLLLGTCYPPTWMTSLASLELALRHRTPLHLMRFLDDAHQRGVLRTVGQVYQFRHARLQDRLDSLRRCAPARRSERSRR